MLNIYSETYLEKISVKNLQTKYVYCLYVLSYFLNVKNFRQIKLAGIQV